MRKGLTLIEILIVMVLIGLSVSVVIPNIGRAYDKIKFRGEAKKVLELARKVKFHAYFYQKNVVLSTSERRLVVREMSLSGEEIPDLPVEIKGEISFSPNGVSSGGEIYLYLREEPKAVIRIDPFSGRIKMDSL